MKVIHVVAGVIVVAILVILLVSTVIGKPLADAQAAIMLQEHTPLELQLAIRQSRQQGSGVNWALMLLLIGIVTIMAYLAIGDRTTKLLRAWKSSRRPHTPHQPPMIETAHIQELPIAPAAPRQLPATTEWTDQS